MALGDVTAAVRSDGWSLDLTVEGFAVGASYAFGLGTNNADLASAKLTLSLTSPGFDSSGNSTTRSRTVAGTKAVRLPYPNQNSLNETSSGGNLVVRVALSEPIYSGDTSVTLSALSGLVVNSGGAGQSSNAASGVVVTNSSTLGYPKVVGRWAWPGFERWTGDTLVEAVVFHHFGRDAKPVACVKFDATDALGNSAAQQVATSMGKTTRTGDANVVSVYSATIPVSNLTQGQVVTARFRAYPWIGDSTSVLDSAVGADGIAAPAADLTPLMGFIDKNNALAVYASVDGTNGSAGGAAASTAAAARLTPFLTLAQALTALKARNNSVNSRNTLDNCYVLMQPGNYTGPGTFTGSNTVSWCEVSADTTNGVTAAQVVFNTAANTACNAYIKFANVTFSGTGAGMLRGNATTGQLWLDSVVWSHASASQWYSWKVAYATRVTMTTNTQGFIGSGSGLVAWALLRGINSSVIVRGHVRCLIGCKQFYGFGIGTTDVALQGPISDNAVFAWNSCFSIPSVVFLQSNEATSITKGWAVIGNVGERITNTTPMIQLAADNSTQPANNVLVAHNTVVGERCNLAYLDNGTTNVNRQNYWDRFNLFRDFNVKTDTFASDPNGARVLNWDFVHGVGCRGSRYEVANFPRAGSPELGFDGINIANTGSGLMGYVSNRSLTGTGTGNGDYRLTDSSPARALIPAGLALIPFDLEGNPVNNSGLGAAGAYQPLIAGGSPFSVAVNGRITFTP